MGSPAEQDQIGPIYAPRSNSLCIRWQRRPSARNNPRERYTSNGRDAALIRALARAPDGLRVRNPRRQGFAGPLASPARARMPCTARCPERNHQQQQDGGVRVQSSRGGACFGVGATGPYGKALTAAFGEGCRKPGARILDHRSVSVVSFIARHAEMHDPAPSPLSPVKRTDRLAW